MVNGATVVSKVGSLGCLLDDTHNFMYQILLLSLKSNPAGNTQRYYITGGEGCQEKRKERKSRKNRSEVAGFSSASRFPARKREAVTHGETI